jgi:uncharacterized membrane protein
VVVIHDQEVLKFFSDFLKSVYVFLVLGLIGMAYSLTMWIRNGVSHG